MSNRLHKLIHSLDSGEKRFFKQFASRRTKNDSKDHIRLFDVISKLENWDEDKVKSKFTTVGYTQFSQLKNYTYNHILSAMRILHDERSNYKKLLALLSDTEFLYNKGLLEECSIVIKRAKKILANTDYPSLRLSLIDWEKKIHIRETISMERHTEIYTSEKETFDRLQSTSLLKEQVDYLHNYLTLEYHHGTDYKQTPLPKIMASKLITKADKQTLNEKILLSSIYNFDYDLSGHFEKEKAEIEKIIQLYHENEIYLAEHAEHYLYSLTNLARINFNVTTSKTFFGILKLIRSTSENSNLNICLPARADAIFLCHFFEQRYYLIQSDYKSALNHAPNFIDDFERINNLLKSQYRILGPINISILYFLTGHFRESLRWTNNLLNNKPLHKIRPEIISSARIIFLLSQYELGNIEYLIMATKSTIRYLKKHSQLRNFEQLTIKILQKLSRQKESHLEVLRWAKEELKKLSKDEFVSVALEVTGFDNWIESKITGVPVTDLIRNSQQAKSK